MDRRQLSVTALRLLATLAVLFATAAHAQQIYQWKDAQGRVHFSDRDPAGGGPVTGPGPDQAYDEDRLSIQVTPHGWDLSAAGREKLDAAVRRTFEVYTGLFRLEMRRPIVVDIHLFGNLWTLQAYLSNRDPAIVVPAGIYGLYVPGHNAIYAWAHDPDEAKVIATLQHEASHVMLDSLAPNAVPWLQEGLAQYFEGLEIDEDGATIVHPVEDSLMAINAMAQQQRQMVTLRDYFALTPARWRHLAHVEQNPVPYAVAWSVAYFLMSRPVGRQIIGELLQDMEKTGKSPTVDAIERRYPGGYVVMEFDWFKWAQRPKDPQTLRW